MRKILFLGENCVYAETKLMNLNGLRHLQYTGNSNDIARKEADGTFTFYTERELAKDYLNRGYAVFYKGNIFFKENKSFNSPTYKKFKELNQKVEQVKVENISYLNGVLYENLKNHTQFAMVRSMIELYEMNIFTLDLLHSKLATYLKPNTTQIVLNELHESVRKAG